MTNKDRQAAFDKQDATFGFLFCEECEFAQEQRLGFKCMLADSPEQRTEQCYCARAYNRAARVAQGKGRHLKRSFTAAEVKAEERISERTRLFRTAATGFYGLIGKIFYEVDLDSTNSKVISERIVNKTETMIESLEVSDLTLDEALQLFTGYLLLKASAQVKGDKLGIKRDIDAMRIKLIGDRYTVEFKQK